MKNKIVVLLFVGYIFLFGILGIIFKDKEISSSERRQLKEFPRFTLDSSYVTKVDEYLLDHFPFREEFRGIKASFNYNILGKLDNNGIYLKDDYIFKSMYPTNEKSIKYFINNIRKTSEYFSEDNNVYMMVIPDKNYYLEEDNFLQIDYDYLFNQVYSLGFNNIDIRDTLNLNDFYETDTHWKQENLDKVVKQMSNVMSFDYIEQIYKENVYDNFYGVYYGESALKRSPEQIRYLENEVINNVYVNYLENEGLHTIYNEDNLDSFDSYEVYLDGASAFVEIYNDNSQSDRELIIFRDSYASSLTPLLINYYKKITLIDNRYISSNYYLDKVDFTNQDILFMYSTLLINSSNTLKG